ncbi:MAG: PepSY domain-containing protein [Chromatiales bacterium]
MSRRHPVSSSTLRRVSVTFHRWHRRIGLIAALFVALLAVTGLLLNHTDAYEFDTRYIRAGWLLDLYDIHAPGEAMSFRAGRHWLSLVGNRLFMDGVLLSERAERLVGAVELDELIAVGVDDALLLLDDNGELQERLGNAEGVPAGMQTIGSGSDGRLVIKAVHGEYEVDIDALQWRQSEQAAVSWSKPQVPDNDLRARLVDAYRGKGLTFERVLLDLHSGRTFGRYGTYVMDGAAVLFLALAVTGLWMWWRQSRKRR